MGLLPDLSKLSLGAPVGVGRGDRSPSDRRQASPERRRPRRQSSASSDEGRSDSEDEEDRLAREREARNDAAQAQREKEEADDAAQAPPIRRNMGMTERMFKAREKYLKKQAKESLKEAKRLERMRKGLAATGVDDEDEEV